MSTPKETPEVLALREAIQNVGGQAELARQLSETPEAKKRGRRLKQQNIHSWLKLGGVPTHWVIAVARIGDVPPHKLDPETYPRSIE